MALIDLMLTDTPRVEYGEEKITQQDIKEAEERNKKMQERIKRTGGIGAKLSNQINTKSFIQSKIKGG